MVKEFLSNFRIVTPMSRGNHSTLVPPIIKMYLVGDMAVGKTSLARAFMQEPFQEKSKSTWGSVVMSKTMSDPHVTCSIWDTAGQERFRSLLSNYMREARCVILVYDVCSRESYSSVRSYWLDYVNRCGEEGVVKILVGNKVDQNDRRIISTEEGKSLADAECVLFMETSAKQNISVNDLFITAAREALKVKTQVHIVDIHLRRGFSVQDDDDQRPSSRGKKRSTCCS